MAAPESECRYNLGYTEYYYSLPSNRIELWFLLESQRFLHPVFREFYKERDVVMEEHRRNVESNVQGLLTQTLNATAFEASPYRNPAGGWPSDIANLRVSDAQAFFEKYYVAANINIAIVGDVSPAEAKRMAERYFGALPTRLAAARHPYEGAGATGPEDGGRGISKPAVGVDRLQAARPIRSRMTRCSM